MGPPRAEDSSISPHLIQIRSNGPLQQTPVPLFLGSPTQCTHLGFVPHLKARCGLSCREGPHHGPLKVLGGHFLLSPAVGRGQEGSPSESLF